MTDKRILVVEDDPDGQEVVGRLLKFHRLNYMATTSGEDALESLKSNEFNVGIFDLALPGMDGFTLLQTIRSTPGISKMPCVAITAYHSSDVAVKAIEAGFAAYFPKPLDSTSFVREIARIIGED